MHDLIIGRASMRQAGTMEVSKWVLMAVGAHPSLPEAKNSNKIPDGLVYKPGSKFLLDCNRSVFYSLSRFCAWGSLNLIVFVYSLSFYRSNVISRHS